MTTRHPKPSPPTHVNEVAIALEAAAAERARIRRRQASAIRNLRSLLIQTECAKASHCLPGCGPTRDVHGEDCPFGTLREDIRTLDAATRREGKRR